jgi:hypothetical protein
MLTSSFHPNYAVVPQTSKVTTDNRGLPKSRPQEPIYSSPIRYHFLHIHLRQYFIFTTYNYLDYVNYFRLLSFKCQTQYFRTLSRSQAPNGVDGLNVNSNMSPMRNFKTPQMSNAGNISASNSPRGTPIRSISNAPNRAGVFDSKTTTTFHNNPDSKYSK